MTSAAGYHEFSAHATVAVDLGLRNVEFKNHKCLGSVLISSGSLLSARTASTTSYQHTPVPFAARAANPQRACSLVSRTEFQNLSVEKEHFVFSIQLPCITELIHLIRPFRALKVSLCRATVHYGGF